MEATPLRSVFGHATGRPARRRAATRSTVRRAHPWCHPGARRHRPLAAAARQVAPRRRAAASAGRRVGVWAPRRGLGVSSVFQEAREALGGPARIHEHTTKGPHEALGVRSRQISELEVIYLSGCISVGFPSKLLVLCGARVPELRPIVRPELLRARSYQLLVVCACQH